METKNTLSTFRTIKKCHNNIYSFIKVLPHSIFWNICTDLNFKDKDNTMVTLKTFVIFFKTWLKCLYCTNKQNLRATKQINFTIELVTHGHWGLCVRSRIVMMMLLLVDNQFLEYGFSIRCLTCRLLVQGKDQENKNY